MLLMKRGNVTPIGFGVANKAMVDFPGEKVAVIYITLHLHFEHWRWPANCSVSPPCEFLNIW
jgi:hypothetical protein